MSYLRVTVCLSTECLFILVRCVYYFFYIHSLSLLFIFAQLYRWLCGFRFLIWWHEARFAFEYIYIWYIGAYSSNAISFLPLKFRTISFWSFDSGNWCEINIKRSHSPVKHKQQNSHLNTNNNIVCCMCFDLFMPFSNRSLHTVI